MTITTVHDIHQNILQMVSFMIKFMCCCTEVSQLLAITFTFKIIATPLLNKLSLYMSQDTVRIWMVKIWHTTSNLLNSPMFSSAKNSHYTVHRLYLTCACIIKLVFW